MTRGLGGESPANVSHYLRGVDFPASKDDLIQKAKDNGAEEPVLKMLQDMPDEQYETMADVMKGYGDEKGSAAG